MLKLGLQSYFLDIPVDDYAVPHCIWPENGFVHTNFSSPTRSERSGRLFRGWMARLALDHFVDKLFQNLTKNDHILC